MLPPSSLRGGRLPSRTSGYRKGSIPTWPAARQDPWGQQDRRGRVEEWTGRRVPSDQRDRRGRVSVSGLCSCLTPSLEALGWGGLTKPSRLAVSWGGGLRLEIVGWTDGVGCELGQAVLDAGVRLGVLESDLRPREEDPARGRHVRNDLEALHGAV